MCRLFRFMVLFSQVGIVYFCSSVAFGASPPQAPILNPSSTARSTGQNNVVELFPNGDFELGIIDADIFRYPKYLGPAGKDLSLPGRSADKPLDGHYSLRLPALPRGGYIVRSRAVPLVPGATYTLSFLARTNANSSSIKAEIFAAGWKKVAHRSFSISTNVIHGVIRFKASTTPRTDNHIVAHYVRLWIHATGAVTIDDLSLKGPGGRESISHSYTGWLSPDQPYAVYDVGANGHMTYRGLSGSGQNLIYKIVSPIHSDVLADSPLTLQPVQSGITQGEVPLDTSRRGYFKVEIYRQGAGSNSSPIVERSYVVIVPQLRHGNTSASYLPFGICAEEDSPRVKTDARLIPGGEYAVMRRIGIGSARVFSLLAPNVVAPKKGTFRFDQIDGALAAMADNGIQPLLVLGENHLKNLPPWMRLPARTSDAVDLISGLRESPKTKAIARRRLGNRNFMDLAAYRNYLEAVFSHFSSRKFYYEEWNEPGHKFIPQDYLHVIALTRQVRDRLSPQARLLGFSSTKAAQLGVGSIPGVRPKFLDDMLKLGGRKDIDILSFHSGHAFLYFSKHPDYRNLETGYVTLLRRVLAMNNAGNPDIWDTERGEEWYSPQRNRLDDHAGARHWEYRRTASSVYDVTRELPMIYAAELAAGVKRIFWFNWKSADQGVNRSTNRYSMFDAHNEPMPQIPAYNAMVEQLRGKHYVRKIDRGDGTRGYLFASSNECDIVAYNWKQLNSTLTFDGNTGPVGVDDIMGNPASGRLSGNSIKINSWPVYIHAGRCNPANVTMH